MAALVLRRHERRSSEYNLANLHFGKQVDVGRFPDVGDK